MTIVPAQGKYRPAILACLVLCIALPGVMALGPVNEGLDPVVYLNFNEGSGLVALDASGHGSAGLLHNVSRAESGSCGGALSFDRMDNYVSIPYRTSNHPEKAVTVSTWFYTDAFEPRDLISTYYNGGYRLGFGDGNDLYWTVNLRGTGDVSVPVRHEGITPRQWHYVTAIYDGKSSRIYLDGALRNQVNASGPIAYEAQNYVMLGAAAGAHDTPDPACPRYFHGGMDEVRIYDQAIPYSQIMDDRFRCSQEPVAPSPLIPDAESPATRCTVQSGSLLLGPGEVATRTLLFTDRNMTGTWQVSLQPGSKLIVTARDQYAQSYPDAWYIELADENGRIDRTIAFPNTHNAPVEGTIPNGKATVSIKYFDGKERFPATLAIQFSSIAPPPPPPPEIIPQPFLNPIIVIYSASWATIIALILVMLWLRKRNHNKVSDKTSPKTGAEEATPEEKPENNNGKKDE
ncbi:MAG: LamG domain-containing protein [Methanomicrobiales archaeon]|nr:LamG domain-containing protein [Methanomicrobiales archaeon]